MKIKIPLTIELTEDQFKEVVKQTKWFNERFSKHLTPQEYFCWIMMADNNIEFLVDSSLRRMRRFLQVEFPVREANKDE